MPPPFVPGRNLNYHDPRPSARLARLCVTGFALAGFTALSLLRAQSTRPGMGAIPYASATGTGVTFRVWAPHATSVAVPGSFNGWNPTANFLVQEAVSNLWSADLPIARTGQEYKYLINGSYWWKDPRSREVTYSGYNSPGANSIIYDPGAFHWLGDTRLPVSSSNLVIYEMHVGSFYDPIPASGGPGKFTSAVMKLDYLAGLGVNAVELLPIAEFPGDNSWGYNPADLYAVENSGYGGPDGLKTFVREAHAQGIRVLLDVVHNHYGPSDLELYGFDVGTASRFYVYTNSGICCTPWGDRPNYATPGVRSFIMDNFKMWLEEYHVDGFRWDAVGAMRHYDPGHVSIPEADSLIQSINTWIIPTNAISLAEDDSSGLGFDGEWSRSFGDLLINQVVMASDASRDMDALSAGMTGSGFYRVMFTETHDLVGDLNGAGAQRLPRRIDPTNPASYAARKRSLLAAATVLTLPGIPMLFMGQEMLQDRQFSSSNPLDWTYATTYANIVNFYRDLIHLRRNLDGVSLGLTGPNLTWHVVRNDTPWKLLAFQRWGAGPDDPVMVVLNFTGNTIPSYWIHTWPANGNWYVHLNSDWTTYGLDFGNYGSSVVNVSGGSGEITIAPYSVLVFSRQALPILEFTSISATNGAVTLTWTGVKSTRQVVQQASDVTGPWKAIFTNQPPTSLTNTLTFPLPASANCFFRIGIVP